MELRILIFILIFPMKATENLEKQFIYVEKEMTWTEALDYCERNNSVLSALSHKDLTFIRTFNQRTEELWTSSYVYATPYISIIGCFRNTTSLNFSSLVNPSILDCYDMCSSSSVFAIMDNECACSDDIYSSMETVDANLCGIPCDGTFFCGGKDTMNVFSVVEDFINRIQYKTNQDFTSCMSYQCLKNEYFFKEVDCSFENVTEVACSTFFSCTFELGDPCFLFQAKNDDLDWTITLGNTTIGPQKAYQGSNYAFVNDSSGDYTSERRAILRSNIDFPDFKESDWCLRYWIYLQNTIGVRLQLYTKNSGVIKSFGNVFSNMQNEEWNYTEVDIQVQKNDIIFFESVRADNGAQSAPVAVDDITLIKGKCRDTYSSLLFMKGEVKCNFEGNKDICFDQDNDDNFDWIIARNGQRITSQKTGPNSSIEGNYYSYINTSGNRRLKNFKAVLISKFNLTDVNITFSMQYHMYGTHINTLRVYLKNGTTELEIFRKIGNQGEDWNRFTNTTKIEGTWKLHISANKGNGTLGYIAIDDIQIKINRRDLKYNWMNQNERCKDNLGVYAINHRQLPNQSCLSFDFDRWTGIIRPQRRGTATKGLAKHPTKVQVYRSLGLDSKYIWEAFNSTVTRPFVCEKNLREEKESVYISATSFGDTIVGVLVACASIIILCIIVFVIYKKRKKATKFKKQNDISRITTKNATYLNDSETKHSTEKKLIEPFNNKQKTHQRKELNDYDKINHDAAKGKYDLSLENEKFRKEREEDYDHLHQTSNSMTPKTDDLYSHMAGSQYESQRIITDDTYAHTVEIENEYGARQLTYHNGNETYDHAHALNIDPSGEYNKLHQDN